MPQGSECQGIIDALLRLTKPVADAARSAPETVEYLLSAGADATLSQGMGCLLTCLHYAAVYGSVACLHVILRDSTVVVDAKGREVTLREVQVRDASGGYQR